MPPGSPAPRRPPTPPQRAAAWTRAARTNVLPDRWIALGYRGGERRFAVLGKPIPDALNVGPDPSDAATGDPAAPLGVRRAVAGRLRPRRRPGHGAEDPACRRGLRRLRPARRARPARDRRRHGERAPDLRPARRPPLHRRARRSPRPGTPTNNTDAIRSAWTAAGEDAAVSLRNERGAALDGQRLRRHAARPRARHRARPAHPRRGRGRGRHRASSAHCAPPCGRRPGATCSTSSSARALRRRDRRRPRALPGQRDRRRRAARPAARPPALRRAAGDLAAAQWRLLDPPDLDAPARPAAQRPRRRLARGARRRPARGARRRPRRRARDRRRDEPGLDALRARGAVAARAGRRRVHARRSRRCSRSRRSGWRSIPALATRSSTRSSRRSPARRDRRRRRRPRRCRRAQNFVHWLVNSGLDTLRAGHAAGRCQHAAVRAAAPRAAAHLRDHRACGSSRARGLAAPGEGDEPGLPARPRRRRGPPRRAAGRRDRRRADARPSTSTRCGRQQHRPARPPPPSWPS